MRCSSFRGTPGSTPSSTSSPGPGAWAARADLSRAGNSSRSVPGDFISLRADDTQDSNTSHLEALILGGQPIGEHVEHYGPFVMNTKAEIGQALEDFEAGRLGTIPPNALMPHVFDPDPVRAEQTGI